MRWLFSSGSRIARALPAAIWRAERSRSLSGETKGTVKDYDVVIVGAGMVGAALASCLGSSELTASLKVALLDAKEPSRKKHAALDDVPEMRVSTLTPATVQLLERCGAWGSLAPPHSAHVEHMQVWDYESGGCLRWSARQVGHENMGYVAENSLIQSALIDTVEENPNIDCLYPVSIASMTLPQGGSQGHGMAADDMAVVRLDGGDEIRARLVVGSDGAASKVRSLAGIQSSIKDYNQRGLVATVEVSEPNTTAWQRFLPTGPFALLPVRNDLFNIVWSTTSEVASAMESTTAEAAIQAFNEALHGGPSHSSSIRSSDLDAFHTPPKITAIAGSMPRSFPLKRQLADKFVLPRLALVGDAYRVVHPLAGQGVNLGFADVKQLHAALEDAIRSGQDLGDASMLHSRYEKHRRLENAIMMTALDAIRASFGIQASPFQAMRGLGLNALNQLKPVKNEIMLYAMGIKTAASHLSFVL